ncbi:MAG: glycosyltransferase family 4 protein [Paludibacteraceae bacterium]|nr:glycosyltransferase family 4 protein [Paludibacteraceae bacterium]
MRVLEVSRYKNNYLGNQLPFVTEQGKSLRKAGCEVEYFLVRGNYVKAVLALKKKIREFKPDIVHAHFGLSAITAELQNLAPIVTTFHNGETLNWHVNLMSSLMSLRAKHVIYVAQHIRDLSYFKAKNYSIIPCGVPMEQMIITPKEEARKQLGWEADKKYILFGGAFSNERKNYKLLREAVERLAMSDERLGKSQESRVKSIECIEMKGLSRAECVLRMCACDLFALPSHSEGSPQALKEAMACNCPCLATDIADVKYLFGSEPGHFILRNPRKTHERWDADEKSLDEMVELLKEALAFEGRTNGRQRILDLELSNEQVARRLIKIYESVIK